jgi:hypothetical protein
MAWHPIDRKRRLEPTLRAINEAVRLEALCKELGVPLVTSAAFAPGSGRNRQPDGLLQE